MSSAESGVGKRIWIFDTTLRDGEQSPGATMTVDEKLEMADALVELGVDIIEAGFPAASPGDFEAVRMIAERVKGATVAGLARSNRNDIERAAQAIEASEMPPGATKTIDLTFSKPYSSSEIEFACHTPGHYEAGMRASLIVE